MKIFTPIKMLALTAGLLLFCGKAMAGDGTKASPYTVAELNAQKDALAASGNTVWVKADLKGLDEDGTSTDNADTEDSDGKTVKHMAGLFGDATGEFVAYSWQILGQLALTDLTNTKDLLISLTYGTEGHPYGNTTYPQYASNEEPADAHFSLEEVHGALSLDITNGLRGYHIPSCYIVPQDVIAVKVSAGYSMSNGAYVNYTNFDGAAETTYVTPKDAALVLMATEGVHDFVLSAALYENTISNGNALNPGIQAGVNAGTTANRTRLAFINDGTKIGFQKNSDENCTVTLQQKSDVFLQVSSLATNFYGTWTWETAEKDWITWAGGKYSDFHAQATEATFDFANNNIGIPVGTSEDVNAGNLGGKTITQNGVTLKFVNAMTMPTRYYINGSRGNQFQAIAGGQMRVTAPTGYAVTSIVNKGNPSTNATTGAITYQTSWEIVKGGGTISLANQETQTWTGNAESVLLNAKGATYLNEIVVTLTAINSETALLADETADSYTDVNGLAAFADAANNALVKLTLTDAIITSGMTNGWGYYIQDATAGAHFYCTGLELEVGDVLNGVVYVKKNNQTMGARICMTEKTSADELTIAHNGTITYVEGSIETINVAANKCRVVKLTGVAVKGTTETTATITDATGSIVINNGKTNYYPYVIQTSLADIDYTDATVTGILFESPQNVNQIMPFNIEGNNSGIHDIEADVLAGNVHIYSLQGVRQSSLKKGINIVNGKKVVMK